MSEKPILFSIEMVKAILDSRKTMTRRVVKPQPRGEQTIVDKTSASRGVFDFVGKYHETHFCPYGQVGGRLWVRETWLQRDNHKDECVDYKADYLDNGVAMGKLHGGWKPSIFMPRWASRITIEITNVRVERLQDITDADAISEGIPAFAPNGIKTSSTIPRKHFASLWDTINHKTYPWASNPWVWVIEFKKEVNK